MVMHVVQVSFHFTGRPKILEEIRGNIAEFIFQTLDLRDKNTSNENVYSTTQKRKKKKIVQV